MRRSLIQSMIIVAITLSFLGFESLSSQNTRPAIASVKRKISVRAENVAKPVFLFSEANGDVYFTAFSGVSFSAKEPLEIYDGDAFWYPVLIKGDGKEPFAGVLLLNCESGKHRWAITGSYRSEVPVEVVAAAREKFCPKSKY